jgi:hypothetical protein
LAAADEELEEWEEWEELPQAVAVKVMTARAAPPRTTLSDRVIAIRASMKKRPCRVFSLGDTFFDTWRQHGPGTVSGC